MPDVEPIMASLIVSSEETLWQTVRCPRPLCRVTEDLIARSYNTGARATHIGNSLSHFIFALSAALCRVGVEAAMAF